MDTQSHRNYCVFCSSLFQTLLHVAHTDAESSHRGTDRTEHLDPRIKLKP
jgi:hypothetical protein